MCSCFDFAVEAGVCSEKQKQLEPLQLSSTKILARCFHFMSLLFQWKKVSLLLTGNVREAKTLQELSEMMNSSRSDAVIGRASGVLGDTGRVGRMMMTAVLLL